MATSLPPLWRNRDYMLLWSGQLASTLGTTASQVVVPLLVLAITNSPEAAGIAGALRSAPYLVFSLPVGALIDRWDRKKVMIRCDAGRALAVATIPVAMAFGALTLWQIYIVSLVEGSLFVFFNIAEVAALPRVVARPQLPKATAQNEAGFFSANIAGPPIGTVLFQAFGHGVPFVANAVTYLVSLISLSRIAKPFHAERDEKRLDLHAEVMEGLKWMWANPLIRYMALLTGGLNFINAATPLALIVLAKRLGAEDAAIGAAFSAIGVGGVLGSLVGGRLATRFSFGQVIIGVIWIEAILFPLYVVVPSFPLLALAAGAYYFLSPTYNVVQFSYRVAIIPDRLQGRVNSIFRLLAFGFMPAGAAVSGILIERLGPVPAVLVLSLWLVAFALVTTFNRHVREAAPL
ncbi:MAG TPA: MFS transporter [Usitatibacter sp.]|jgi:predicted MFS family arabinose efflux permease|nr:MFS transporter [Usitatibacter sp.]